VAVAARPDRPVAGVSYPRNLSEFVRRLKSGDYTLVPAPVADEWYADMVVRGEWLWPVRITDDPATGYERFRLDGLDGEATGIVISFDAQGDRALVTSGDHVVWHTADGHHIFVDDVEQFGATIDPALRGVQQTHTAAGVSDR
jgi:hypothetical protein